MTTVRESPATELALSGRRPVQWLDLDPVEAVEIDALVREAASAHGAASAPSLLAAASGIAHRLPTRLVETLLRFRLHEPAAALVVRGLPVDDREIGPTPPDWRDQPEPWRTAPQETYLVLVACLLGEVFGWSTLQDGRLVHDVLPMPNQEREQSGHGTVRLEWHTEDGFHPYRCDYLLLLGLRNHDAVPTTMAALESVRIDPAQRAVLREPRFLIRPDTEHLNRARALTDGTGTVHEIQLMQDAPEPCAVLFGHPDDPYLRIDPAFMTARHGDTDAAAALEALVMALEENLVDVPLSAGDLLVVDNYLAVHGRSAFRARFDGTDRWLKKVVVTRDLRKSRAHRAAAHERVLH